MRYTATLVILLGLVALGLVWFLPAGPAACGPEWQISTSCETRLVGEKAGPIHVETVRLLRIDTVTNTPMVTTTAYVGDGRAQTRPEMAAHPTEPPVIIAAEPPSIVAAAEPAAPSTIAPERGGTAELRRRERQRRRLDLVGDDGDLSQAGLFLFEEVWCTRTMIRVMTTTVNLPERTHTVVVGRYPDSGLE